MPNTRLTASATEQLCLTLHTVKVFEPLAIAHVGCRPSRRPSHEVPPMARKALVHPRIRGDDLSRVLGTGEIDMTTETGRPPVEDMIADMGDDALAEIAIGWKEEAQRLSRGAGLALHALTKRMRENRAKVLDTKHWSGKMKPGPIQRTVNDPGLMKDLLDEHLSPGDVVKGVEFVRPEPHWQVSQSGLNELAKRGGRILEIIEDQRKSVRGDDVLELKRKETDGER